ncbi:MAG: AMP-binding protein [Anaerobiospirillum sp.]|nr:AMP-binding protein [Anaerobiospirillum sp.]
MSVAFKVLTALVTALWPLIIFAAVMADVWRYVLPVLAGVIGLKLITTLKARAAGPLVRVGLVLAALALGLCLLSLAFSAIGFMFYYPVAVNLIMLAVFASSLRGEQSIVERLARLQDPELSPRGVRYTRNVTKVWCVFFVLNGAIATVTAIIGDLKLWTWWNGLLSYGAMGLMFGGEYLLRCRLKAQERAQLSATSSPLPDANAQTAARSTLPGTSAHSRAQLSATSSPLPDAHTLPDANAQLVARFTLPGTSAHSRAQPLTDACPPRASVMAQPCAPGAHGHAEDSAPLSQPSQGSPMQVSSLATWLHDERVIAYDRSHRLTTREAQASIAALRAQLGTAQRVALVLDSPYSFALAFMAVLSLGQRPVILGHHNPSLLSTQHELFDLVLTDLPTLPSLAKTAGLNRPVLEIASLVLEPPALSEDELTATKTALSGIAASSVFELYTSGSTGSPKAVLKTVGEMEAEAQVLAQFLSAELDGATLLATVYPYHMYGLTFSVFLPWSTGTILYLPQIHYSEELAALPEKRYVLISSPAFLKRLDFKLKAPALSAIVSAGGPLAAEIRQRLQAWSGISATEIYGSTEAGVMAQRQNVSDEAPFTLFSDVTLEVSPERTILHSGHVASSLTLDDRVELVGARTIKLLGRSDRIVKIEEKRVSLNAIEAALQQLPGVSGAAACVVQRDGRDLIGAALVMAVNAPEHITGSAYLALRRQLAAQLEPHALPRIFIKLPALPENALGKRDSRALSELFATNMPRP